MGELTAAEIVTEGGHLAGRDDLAARMHVLFPRWLDSIARSWPWPILNKQASGVTLPAGTASLTVGRSGAVTDRVSRIRDNVWVYTMDMRTRGRVRVRSQPTMPVNQIVDTSQGRGMPKQVKVTETSLGLQWLLEFYPAPEQSYLLAFDYTYVPTYSQSAPVWYENDLTSIHAVAALILEYADGPEQRSTMAMQASLSSMVAQDRMRHGLAPGINDQIQLDDSIFL